MDYASLQQTMLQIDKLSKKAEELVLMQKDIKKIENDILERQKILLHKERTINFANGKQKETLIAEKGVLVSEIDSLKAELKNDVVPVRELEANCVLILEKKRTFRELLEEKENSILNSTSVIMSGREDLIALNMQYEALISDLSDVKLQIEYLESLERDITTIEKAIDITLDLKSAHNLRRFSGPNEMEVNVIADKLNNFASPYNNFLTKLGTVLSSVILELPEIDLTLFFFDSIVDKIAGSQVHDKLLFLVQKVYWVKKQFINIQAHILLQENLINHEIDKVELNKVKYLLNHS